MRRADLGGRSRRLCETSRASAYRPSRLASCCPRWYRWDSHPLVTLSQIPPWLSGSVLTPISKIDAEDYLTGPAVAGMGQPMAEAEMQREAVR
jgi:hypothetical protein